MSEQESSSIEPKHDEKENQKQSQIPEEENISFGNQRPLLTLHIQRIVSDEEMDRIQHYLKKFSEEHGYDGIVVGPDMKLELAPSMAGISEALLLQGDAMLQMADRVAELCDLLAKDQDEEVDLETYLDGTPVTEELGQL